MTNEIVTVDTIINKFKEWVENKQIIHPSKWLDGAAKLNVLIADEHDKLFRMEQDLAKRKLVMVDAGEKISRAELKIEASDEYREMQMQKAKIEQVEEHIRIAKHQARLKDNEFGNQQ